MFGIRIRSLSIALLVSALAMEAVHGADGGLSKAQVKNWIATEIAVTRLQRHFKQEAASYEDMIKAFYAARAKLVRKHGYASVSAYDALDTRIMNALSAMDEAKKLEARRAERARRETPQAQAERKAQADEEEARLRSKLREIEDSPNLSAAAKKTMRETFERRIAMMRKMGSGETGAARVEWERETENKVIAPTRRDWPAVRYYRAKIEQLEAWYNGNSPKPPRLE